MQRIPSSLNAIMDPAPHASPRTAVLAFAWLAVLVYFFWFARTGLTARFAPDDMMNLGKVFEQGWSHVLAGNLLFFTTAYRPMGGIFYLSIYELFGLNPLPYRVAILALLTGNVWLLYRWASLLSGSHVTGIAAAWLGSFHAALFHIYYSTSLVYDVLCFTFYFLAFNYYLRIRISNRLLTTPQTVLVCLAYIGALNSKEMAVTLPVFLLLYEWLNHPPRSFRQWIGQEARTPLILAAITAIYVVGKVTGPDSLVRMKDYSPVFSADLFFRMQASYLEALFYRDSESIPVWFVAGLWLFIAAIAWRSGHPVLRFCWFWIILSTLPVVFIGRGGGPVLYLPLAGWSLLITALCSLLLRRVRVSVFVMALIALLAVREHARQFEFARDGAAGGQDLTWSVIRMMEPYRGDISRGARVLYLEDPFADWDTYFIAHLVYGDPTLQVTLHKAGKPEPPRDEQDQYDHVFAFRDRGLIDLRCGDE